MPIDSISITEKDSPLIWNIARQQHMEEGADMAAVQENLQAAIESGQTVTVLREMNTNAILQLTVGGQRVIDKFNTASLA